MDDSKYPKRFTHGIYRILELKIAIIIILIAIVKNVNGIDDEIEQIRKEGIDKFDVSILIEKRVDFLHTRITLRPLILGLLNFERLVQEFQKSEKSEFGNVLYAKIENMHH